MIGNSLTHYRITAKLGEGGMGEVYRATDTKLGREVAIKVLPASFSHDPQSLVRFEREAKALATLNHPHIAAIHGFDADQGTHFLVLELVEGETLSERLRRGRLPVEEALRVARQMAEAVEAAHAKGIIHRDLKPGNIKFTSDSRVKVLDFGLAKMGFAGSAGVLANSSPRDGRAGEDAGAPSQDGPDASTRRADSTEPGKVMGTPAYMSPEQARGLEVDKRTDVWAFGCCLFECLAGSKPFRGETVTDLMAEVLKSEPDWTRLPAETPREVATLLRRCLEKDPRRRLSSLGDIAILLDESTQTSHRPAEPVATIRQAKQSLTSRPNWGWAVATALGAALVVAGFFLWRNQVQGQRRTQIRSVAVLPFENQSPNPGPTNSWVSASMQDEIRTQLSELKGLSVKRGDKSDRSLQEAARALGVDALVTGSYVLREGRLRFTPFLVDGATGSDTTLGTQEGSESEILELQKKAAVAIAEKLRGRLTDQERGQIAARSDVRPEAYIAFRNGLEMLDRLEFAKARESFNKAIEINPGPGMEVARNQLVLVYLVEMTVGGNKADHGQAWKDFKNHVAGMTEEVRNRLEFGEARLWASMAYDRDWKEFRRLHANFQDRIDRSREPDIAASTLFPVTWYYALVEGRLTEATHALRAGAALDPRRLWRLDEASQLMEFGRTNEAMQIVRELRNEWPAGIESQLSSILLANGDVAGAKTAMEGVLRFKPNPAALCIKARIHLAEGEAEAARVVLDALEQQKRDGFHIPYGSVAMVYGELGHFADAFRWLQDGLINGRGDFSMISIRGAPFLKIFAAQPRYWQVVDQLDFPPLPVEHSYYGIEQRMRYGRGSSAVSSSATNSQPMTLAVLPFTMGGARTDDDDLGEGLAYELISALTGIKELTIRGLEASRLKKEGKSDKQIASELKASHMLSGVITRFDDRLRVNAFLTQVTDGNVLWTTNYNDRTIDLLAVRTNLARQVTRTLRISLGGEAERKLSARPTANPEAYDLYLKGRAAWNKRTLPDLERAIGFFNQALEKDTNFALAYSGLATVHAVVPNVSRINASDHSEKLARFARKALELDPRLAEPHAVLGFHRAFFFWDWEGAEREFQTAISLDPNSAEAHRWYGDMLTVCLRYEEALHHNERAFQIEPETRANRITFARIRIRMKQHRDQGIQDLTRWIESDPHWLAYQRALFWAHLRNLQLDEAETVLNRMSDLLDGEGVTLGKPSVLHRAYLLALKSRKAEARSLLVTGSGLDGSDALRALTLHALGDAAAAMTLLEGLDEKDGSLQTLFLLLPDFSGLYGEPRFRAILRKVNLDRYIPIPSSTNAP